MKKGIRILMFTAIAIPSGAKAKSSAHTRSGVQPIAISSDTEQGSSSGVQPITTTTSGEQGSSSGVQPIAISSDTEQGSSSGVQPIITGLPLTALAPETKTFLLGGEGVPAMELTSADKASLIAIAPALIAIQNIKNASTLISLLKTALNPLPKLQKDDNTALLTIIADPTQSNETLAQASTLLSLRFLNTFNAVEDQAARVQIAKAFVAYLTALKLLSQSAQVADKAKAFAILSGVENIKIPSTGLLGIEQFDYLFSLIQELERNYKNLEGFADEGAIKAIAPIISIQQTEFETKSPGVPGVLGYKGEGGKYTTKTGTGEEGNTGSETGVPAPGGKGGTQPPATSSKAPGGKGGTQPPPATWDV